MHKKEIVSSLLGEKYFCLSYDSGIKVVLYPMKNASSTFAAFATNYGSVDTAFRLNGENDFTTVPEGIAHYLEHKMFESEEGDAFKLFAKTGASANAFTSFDKTCYIFSCTSDFEENLKSLLTFVQDPYFTDENVQKEQGIIGQEIKMYQDDPDWRVMFNLLKAIYHYNPVRIDIAGTVESISKINKELLYKCYETFYNPSNMVISIAGNFDVDAAIKIIEDNLKSSEKAEIERNIPQEPDDIVSDYVEEKLSVSMPMFSIGFKEDSVDSNKIIKTSIISEILLGIIVGRGSDLYEKLYNKGLINNTFSSEAFIGRGYNVLMFSGESENPKEVLNEIKAEIKRIKSEGICNEDVDRLKKAMLGVEIRSFSEADTIALDMVSACFSDNELYDTIDAISSVTLQEVETAFEKMFDFDKVALSVIKPNN